MIPSFEEFLYPVLYALQDGKPLKRDDLREACIKKMGFSEEDLKERIGSGKKYKIVDRLQWATYYLLKSGLLCRPNQATDMLTPEGLALVTSGITNINRKYLREHYKKYREFEQHTREAAKLRLQERNAQKKKNIKKQNVNHMVEDKKDDLFPLFEDQSTIVTKQVKPIQFCMTEFEKMLGKMSEQYKLLNEGLMSELVSIINDFDKESFRCLLLELIPHMGYSQNFEEFSLNATMEHEVALSGLFNIDELGMNRFFVLAHNKTEDEISLSEVQSFIGALSSIGITSGVYITTSMFTHEARTYQTQGAVRCLLIDGEQLAKLMIKFNIGVIKRKVFEVKEIDQEYLFTRLTRK